MNTRAVPKILFIDDDQMLISCYTSLLNSTYATRVAYDGVSALTIIQSEEKIDIVLLDYRLPDMPGLDVLKEIKKRHPHVPVIFVTAFGDEDVAAKSFRFGAREYIKKPFGFAELSEKLRFCLSLKMIPNATRRVSMFHEVDTRVLSGPGIDNCTVFKIQKAIKFIEDNFMWKIGLPAVAHHAGMSKYHFSKMFKKITGTTYQSYVNNRRIEKAKDLIKRSGTSITEIAFSVGYDDLTHFGRLFKRIVGYTPSQYKVNAMPPRTSGTDAR